MAKKTNGLDAYVSQAERDITPIQRRILTVGPDQSSIDSITNALEGNGYSLNQATLPEGNRGIGAGDYYDVVIVDVAGARPNKGRLPVKYRNFLRNVRSHLTDTPSIAIIDRNNPSIETELAEEGISSIRHRPITEDSLRVDVERAIEYLELFHDGLTGFYNRKYGDEEFQTEISLIAGRKKKNPTEITTQRKDHNYLSLIIIDLDNFKKVNDTYGHIGGDNTLRRVAEEIRKHTRNTDIHCRYGGDELTVAFPGLPYVMALTKAEKIRKGVESLEIEAGDGRIIKPTISVGFATISTNPEDTPLKGIEMTDRGLVEAADKALYLAKERGRNRVVGYGVLLKQHE